MYEEILSRRAERSFAYKKRRGKKSCRSKVLALVSEANANVPVERRVVPRAALAVMNRAEKHLSALSSESRELGVLREVARFITAHQDTFKAQEYDINTDLLPVGHPKSLKNLSADQEVVRHKYAQWLSADSSLNDNIRSLVASAHSLEPGTVERKHAFTRLSISQTKIPTFFKTDHIPALVAAFSFRGGNSSAARRARVALQWRDRYGRWIEMGRGIDFNFRLPSGEIGSAGGTYVGVNAKRGYSTENGKPVANAGLVEIRGHDTLPDGIYSIESANASPVKARIPGKALKKAGVKRGPATRKPTAEQMQSKDIPNLSDLLKTRVDAPSGWTKQDDNSFISDDDYKLIPNDSGFSLHRLDKDGNTGDKVGDVTSWAEAQSLAEKDTPEYDKFKERVGVTSTQDKETAEGIRAAEDVQQERKEVIARLDSQDEGVDAEAEPAVPSTDEVPVRVPSVIEPTSPTLFKDFDVPQGAFQLRTIDFEPDGRVDEESTDFTDDPERLATKYALPELTAALTQALIGDKDNAVIAQIVDSSVGDDEESLDLEGVDEIVDTPVVQAGRANGTGAGQLEFNQGAEYVPAEALYNAIFLAGGDPNRVIANAYDAVNGNRNNLDKLHNAAGGVPDAEEAQLIDDIFAEIKQIKEASTPEEISQKGANPINDVDENAPLPGELLYNVPVDFNNPDFYDLDPNPYPPMREEPDEFGFTDDPAYIARNFEQADLLEQFETAVTDGSGSVYLVYDDQVPLNEGTYEVPAEAIRDALQLQGVNTNDVLERIRAESIDFEKEPEEVKAVIPEEPTPTPTSEEPEPSYDQIPFDGSISILKDWYDRDMLADADFVAYLPDDGSIVFKDAWDTLYVARADQTIVEANTTEEWLTDPRGAGQAGWKLFTSDQRRSLANKIIGREEAAPAPAPTPTPTPAAPTPALAYPGPREPGYSPNNTTIVAGGTVVGKGSRVKATKDGKLGTVVAIQNNPEYLRIKFDDGTTAVRAAAKVRAISNADGAAPKVIETPVAEDNIRRRLEAPGVPAPRVGRSGDTRGVNDESTRPAFLEGLTNEGAQQIDFAQWGERDAEIAKAARERVTRKAFEDKLKEYLLIDNTAENKDLKAAANNDLIKMLGDVYGAREGISFGGEFYTIDPTRITITATNAETPWKTASADDIQSGKFNYEVELTMNIRDVSGTVVGNSLRTVTQAVKLDDNGNIVSSKVYAKNNFLSLNPKGKKKGFATAFNRYAENWYIANNIDEVHVYAAGGGQYQGGFVWALNGFDWDPAFDSPNAPMSSFKRAVKNKQEEEQVNAIQRKLDASKKPGGGYDPAKAPTPLEYALVGWYPGAEDWLGKRVMTQLSWHGIKRLNPGAREQRQAANYTQIKNADRRVLENQNLPNVSPEFQGIVATDDFKSDKDIAPYVDEIRDVLRNNRSLAFLAPDAKAALGRYVSTQLIAGANKRKLPLDDAFRLRSALNAEYRADYQYTDPLNVAEILSTLSIDDFDSQSEALTSAGFSARRLAMDESGVNMTFEVTHKPSGQVFYVKNEEFAARFSDVAGGITELEAVTILNAAGVAGLHNVLVGKNEKNLIVMSRAGSGIPIAGEPINGWSLSRRGTVDANGRKVVISADELVDYLAAPEDVVRMSLFDMLGNNQDRHNGNWMAAFNKVTGKVRLFPIDNTVGVIPTDSSTNAEEFLDMGGFMEADIYSNVMPQLIDRVGSNDLFKMYENEVKNITTNLNNPLYQPKGFEMDAIIAKWGTYDAFKDAITERLNRLVTPGNSEYNSLKGALRLGYWG